MSSETDVQHQQDNHDKKPTLFSTLKGAFFKAIFVLGSAFLVFESTRNSLTYHVGKLWGGVGDVWQELWEKVLSVTGDDIYTLDIWGTFFITNLVFWSIGSIYCYFDVTTTPKFLRKYKIQPETNEPVDPKKFKNLIWTVFLNQTVVYIPLSFLAHKALVWRGRPDLHILPDFQTVVIEFFFCAIVEELFFYYSHKMLHHKWIYKHIHKKHHEWTASVSFVALYAHPIEHFLSNLLPAFMGPFLCGSHVATTWLWFTMVLMSTLNAHSGYHFPLLPSPEFHDYHHLKFNQNFGVLGILDSLHGTDSMFRSSKQAERHYMLLTSTPARELIPDEGTKPSCKKFE